MGVYPAPASYQLAALGEVVAAPLIVGAVLSMLIPETVVLALLPALSVAVPLDDWPLPSASVASAAQLWIPESVSADRKSAVEGKRVDLGGGRMIEKKKA